MFKYHDTWIELHNSRNAKKYCRILSTVEQFLAKAFSLIDEKDNLISTLENEFALDDVVYLEKLIERDSEDDYLEIDECIKKLTDTMYLDECLDVYIIDGEGFNDFYCYIFGKRRESYANKIDSLLKARSAIKIALKNYKNNSNYNIQEFVKNTQKDLSKSEG